MPERPGDAPGGMISIPRPEPRPDALLQVSNDLAGDPALNVGTVGIRAGVGLAHLLDLLGLEVQRV